MIVEREENIEAMREVVKLEGEARAIPDSKRLAWKLPRCLGIHGDKLDIPKSLTVCSESDIRASVAFDGAEVSADGFLDGAIEAVFKVTLLPSDVYYITGLPYELDAGEVVLIAAVALTMSFLATLYPAWRAARTQPAEALRYE